MDKRKGEKVKEEEKIVKLLKERKETLWINPKRGTPRKNPDAKLIKAKIDEAEERLKRFAPLIEKLFPQTKQRHGIIESDLVEIDKMGKTLGEDGFAYGKLLLKEDNELPIAGSVKARGGIYEILKFAETIAIREGNFDISDDYRILAEDKYKNIFSTHTIQVGSTGNLGLSIGIISAKLGFKVKVHMSQDARQWKKDLLRQVGAQVLEYEGDYSQAVKEGRRLSDADPKSYFVDDENSEELFLGYAVAGRRLKKQLDEKEIIISKERPLFVYLPCGVGGAPGGIAYGLHEEFGDSVHTFFVEPTDAPCMVLGMATDKHSNISVQDIGLSGRTSADGLAVGRPSEFVGRTVEPFLSGIFTIDDTRLESYLRGLFKNEGIFVEPSGCAGFIGPESLEKYPQGQAYIRENSLEDFMDESVHIVWATGGGLVPEEIRSEHLSAK